MLHNPAAEAIMQDAREAQAASERLLAAGDWRDAADKGWLAARNATAAAVLEVTGAPNSNSTGIGAGLRRLARQRGGEWARLHDDYVRIIRFLHGQAFYDGIYSEEVGVWLRGAAGYIRRAEELAAGGAGDAPALAIPRAGRGFWVVGGLGLEVEGGPGGWGGGE